MRCRYRFLAAYVHAALLLAAAIRSAAGQDVQPIAVERNVAVPMRDGTILRADVYRPATGDPLPVLVMRTPYGKPAKVDEQLVRAGYIVVTQDTRGRYASNGQYESFLRADSHDGVDGFDTVEWAARLPGSNGKVGMFGTSYNAFLQWKASGQRPPSLVALAAFSIPARYTDLEGPGAIRPGRRLKWWQGTISPDLHARQGGEPPHTGPEAAQQWEAGEGEKLLKWLPRVELPSRIFASEAPFVKAWLREPWRDPWNLPREAANTTVPNLNVCGWYDHCNGSIDLHTAIVQHGATELARKHSTLIVGPWGHNSLGQRRQGEIDFGPEAQLDLSQLHRQWFGHWLRQDEAYRSAGDWPQVKVFVMGLGQWRTFSEWPPQSSMTARFFLSSNGSANTPTGNGQLLNKPPVRPGHDTFEFDPRNPVPTLWTKQLFTVPADQRPLAQRQDILVYQSALLTEPVQTIGNPEVVLHASSSCPDTDFFARLIDVGPDGRAIDIALGMVRARYRHGLERSELLTPGEVTEFRIRLRPTAHRFLPGHRIRLDVTSSDFPNYDFNPNTAADPNSDSQMVTARQRVDFGGAKNSRLMLPIVR